MFLLFSATLNCSPKLAQVSTGLGRFSSRRRHTRCLSDWEFRRVLFRSLGHRPFTAVTGVRIPLGTPFGSAFAALSFVGLKGTRHPIPGFPDGSRLVVPNPGAVITAVGDYSRRKGAFRHNNCRLGKLGQAGTGEMRSNGERGVVNRREAVTLKFPKVPRDLYGEAAAPAQRPSGVLGGLRTQVRVLRRIYSLDRSRYRPYHSGEPARRTPQVGICSIRLWSGQGLRPP